MIPRARIWFRDFTFSLLYWWSAEKQLVSFVAEIMISRVIGKEVRCIQYEIMHHRPDCCVSVPLDNIYDFNSQ